ncbi:hypothetical protein ACFL3S_09890 [Gemmatimonadota bacterium]
MTHDVEQLNLTLAWIWIVLGTILGLILGSFFHREDFLDGYGSFKRRLYRLAHVAFFGLAILNILFFFTFRILPTPSAWLAVASWSFVVGALSMPTCCILVAHQPRLRNLFAIPVGSVLLGSILTLREVWKL